MISITPQYIQRAGGILQAISLKSAETVRDVLGDKNIKPLESKKLDRLERILVHASPHLDEYLAILLFRACLPQEKLWDLPLEECSLSSTNNDHLAMATWPSSAVMGIGGTHRGGANPLLVYDEHVEAGKERRDSSCAMQVSKQYLKDPGLMFKLIGEVDHVDANANAHHKHLGNYIKWMQETEYVFSLGASSKDTIKGYISSMWKQSLVEACLTAFILGIHDKKPFSIATYWKKPAQDSLRQYAQHSPLKDDPVFAGVFNTLLNNVTNYRTSCLETTQPDGRKVVRRDRHGREIRQLLVMPYLAALCQDYWGPYLGHIILAHFWDARVHSQMTFQKIQAVLENTIGDGSREIPSVRTPVGELSFRHISVQEEKEGKSFTPWVIELVLNVNMPNAKAPLLSFINGKNNGIGYLILRNPSTNSVVLNKGRNSDQNIWTALFEKLVQLEGNADVRAGENRAAGCWHRVENSNKTLADFVLNGNRAHQYVPPTSLDADGLVELVCSLRA